VTGRASCRGSAFWWALGVGGGAVIDIDAGIGWTDGATTGIGAGTTGAIRFCSSIPLVKSESEGDSVSM
jgi:hypothetical protein